MADIEKDFIEQARECFNLEIAALQDTAQQLDHHFVQVIEALGLAVSKGHKLIFSGVGKNIPIAQKLVGTFNSTGVPTCFLDPCQALHGDLGLCAPGDLAFLLSNSGETEEMLAVVTQLKRLEVKKVAITARAQSQLAQHSDYTLTYRVQREACPLNLAPTASTTATLALGDALAMVFLKSRRFSRDDFARYHPGGNLGKNLLLTVKSIMRSHDRFACLPHTSTVKEAILAITKAHCGVIALTDPDSGQLSGAFSDGDLRRCILANPHCLDDSVAVYMTPKPKTIGSTTLAADAIKLFQEARVNDLIVVDGNNHPIGIVDGQDLPKLKLI